MNTPLQTLFYSSAGDLLETHAFTSETQTVSTGGPPLLGGPSPLSGGPGFVPAVAAVARMFDAFGRLASCNGAMLSYDANGRLASLSNETAVVTYQYSADGCDLGYALALSNGVVFTRSLTRDEWRRSIEKGGLYVYKSKKR